MCPGEVTLLTQICDWILENQPNSHTRPIPFYWPRRYMEGMGLEFTPVMGRRLLGHLSMFGTMAGASGTHS